MKHAFIFGAEYIDHKVVSGDFGISNTGTYNCRTPGRNDPNPFVPVGTNNTFCFANSAGTPVADVKTLAGRSASRQAWNQDWQTKKIARLTLLLSVFAVNAALAHGEMKCTTEPKSAWKPHTELEQKLTKEGWVVRRMEMTASCYEVYAKDPQGKRIEAFFDPVTLARVEEK